MKLDPMPVVARWSIFDTIINYYYITVSHDAHYSRNV